MSAIWVLSVGGGALSGSDDAARAVGRALSGLGAPVSWRLAVEDDEAALEPTLRAGLESAALVVVLGQPGGSAGEIVPRVLSRLTGARLVLHERRLALLEAEFARRGRAMPRRLDRLALLPQGALLWVPPDGEPGWTLEARGGAVAVLPGGSPHLDAIVQEMVLPLARARVGRCPAQVARTLLTTGLAAAEAEERLGSWLGKEGAATVSCALVEGDVHVRLTGLGPTLALAEAALEPLAADVRAALGVDCYGRDEDTLEEVVGRLLLERGFQVSLAESCTGGLLGHRLTNVAGSSRYVERGVVVYSNRAKEELLGVPEALLRAHGAVSEPVALAMAAGICRVSGTQCALAVTGIAGPDGGSAEKPVGTVWIACAAPGGVEARRHLFPGGRVSVKWRSSQAALDMLRRRLLR